MKEEIYLREYLLSEQMKKNLDYRMFKITGLDNLYSHDLRAVNGIETNNGSVITSILYNSKYTNLEQCHKLYNLIFNDEKFGFRRTKNYIKFRKRKHLEKDETLITVCSYLQSSGITDEATLLNKLLLFIDQ